MKIKIKRYTSAPGAPLSLGRDVAKASCAENASPLLNVEDFSKSGDGLTVLEGVVFSDVTR
jgi:hypothetical protein